MAKLAKHLIKVAQSLKAESDRVHWQEVVSTIGPLDDEERIEAEAIGIERLAKWAAKHALPKQGDLFYDDWVDGSIQNQEGARIARHSADIADYDWQIAQIDKSIARWTRTRDKLVRERAALISPVKES